MKRVILPSSLHGFFVLFALICSAEVSRLLCRRCGSQGMRAKENAKIPTGVLTLWAQHKIEYSASRSSRLFFFFRLSSPICCGRERGTRRRGKADTSSPGGGSKASRQILFGNRACCFVHQPEKFLSAELLYTPFGWASQRRLATLCGSRLFASASS
jgi:hypothetical protein